MIYFICCKNKIHFFIEYIDSLQYNYKNIQIIASLPKCIDYSSKYIFIQNIPNISYEILNKLDCYLLNTEQLSKPEWISYLLSTNVKILDYSLSNIECYLPYKSNIYYLPYMVNKNEIFNYDKIYNVAAVGCWDDSYRMNITNKIQNINIIDGFGMDRDERLFKHKILLNVHFNERFKIFEQLRCNRCIFNKMIVITERSLHINDELKEYIIECDYDDLVSTTKHVLENYDFYYNKIFKNFDIDRIEIMYKKINDPFLNDTNKDLNTLK